MHVVIIARKFELVIILKGASYVVERACHDKSGPETANLNLLQPRIRAIVVCNLLLVTKIHWQIRRMQP